MSNLTDLAFPLIEENGTKQSVSTGFTKHEYAAILIAQGLVAKYNLKTPEDQNIIAQLSYELAGEVLGQFK